MFDFVALWRQALEQYGLLGLLVVFLLTGPLFTVLRTRQTDLRTKARAQALLNEFLVEERQRSERLEGQLAAALKKLDKAEDKVERLQIQLIDSEQDRQLIPALRQQVQILSDRVSQLESVIANEREKNQALRDAMLLKDERIDELERTLRQQVREDQQ